MWKIVFGLLPLLAVFSSGQNNPKVICYYNSTSSLREAPNEYTINDLEAALPFCTHLVYGWARVNFDTNRVESANPAHDLDTGKGHYRQITSLKRRFPHLQILLSIGGQPFNKERTEKYNAVLESPAARLAFINSAFDIIKTHNFDGIDLAWEFQPEKPKRIRSTAGQWFYDLKVVVGAAGKSGDKNADEHREEFTMLLRDLYNALKTDNYLITTTILPNVDFAKYYDVEVIGSYLDFVVISAFDYSCPDRNDKQADYFANIYPLPNSDERNSDRSVHGDFRWWQVHNFPLNKLVMGIPAFGRTWEINEDSGVTGVPPIKANGRSEIVGEKVHIKGLLTWPEVCEKLPNANRTSSSSNLLRKVGDPTKRYGSYAFRSASVNGEWVSYEEPSTAQAKGRLVKENSIGGIGIFNLDFDDYRGICQREKYPILRAAKQPLL